MKLLPLKLSRRIGGTECFLHVRTRDVEQRALRCLRCEGRLPYDVGEPVKHKCGSPRVPIQAESIELHWFPTIASRKKWLAEDPIPQHWPPSESQ